MSDQIKFLLNEDDIPKDWYNIVADLPEPPAPVLHPGTGEAIGPDDLAPLFPRLALNGQLKYPRRFVKSIVSGGPAPFIEPDGSKKRSIRPLEFITSTKGSVQPGVISLIQRLLKHSSARKKGSSA